MELICLCYTVNIKEITLFFPIVPVHVNFRSFLTCDVSDFIGFIIAKNSDSQLPVPLVPWSIELEKPQMLLCKLKFEKQCPSPPTCYSYQFHIRCMLFDQIMWYSWCIKPRMKVILNRSWKKKWRGFKILYFGSLCKMLG